MNIDIPKYTPPRKEAVPIHVDPVARSIARPDAFAKPGTVGNASRGTRVRVTMGAPKRGRPRKRLRDPRDVQFY